MEHGGWYGWRGSILRCAARYHPRAIPVLLSDTGHCSVNHTLPFQRNLTDIPLEFRLCTLDYFLYHLPDPARYRQFLQMETQNNDFFLFKRLLNLK